MTTSNARGGLLALTVAFIAGIHAALVPEHLREMPPLGYLFIFAAAIGAAIALALMVRPNDVWIPRLAVLALTTQVVAWAMFSVVHIPGFTGTPEPIEPIALVCKAAELLGIALALPLAAGASRSAARSGSRRTLAQPAVVQMGLNGYTARGGDHGAAADDPMSARGGPNA